MTQPATLPIPPLNVSPEQAAAILGVSRSRVYDLLAAGTIISIKDGKRRLIPVVELERYRDGQKAKKASGVSWRDHAPPLHPAPSQRLANLLDTEIDEEENGPDARTVRTVYFIQAEPNGLIKIGIATDIETRLRTIQAYSPVPLRLLKTVTGTLIQEGQIHSRFAHLRQHGEWFTADADLLAFIESVKDDWE